MELNLEIQTKVNNLMHEGFEIPLDKLTPEAKLYEDLSLDSLDAVDMLVHLEENLGIKVAGERFMHVRTLGDVHTVVAEVVQEAKDSASDADAKAIINSDQTQAELG